MKTLLLSLVFYAVNASANESILHTCLPKKSGSEISKIVVSYDNGYFLSIFDKENATQVIKVDEYNDMTYIGYISNDSKFDLYLNYEENGVWTEGMFTYGNTDVKHLRVECK